MKAAILREPNDFAPVLTEAEFERFRRFIYEQAGIDMPPSKRALVQSRLAKRLRTLGLSTYSAYWRYMQKPGCNHNERQRAVNLLSTNETYFFREPQHFNWLSRHAVEAMDDRFSKFRIWSAASSTGEEAYTIAIVLAEALGVKGAWEIMASDVNTRVIRVGQRAIYPLNRVEKVPPHLLQRYFLRGRDEYAGKLRVAPELVQRVAFRWANLLHASAANIGEFDVIFLRNVLIYFDEATKTNILRQLCRKIRPGGYLLVGHSEVVRNPSLPLRQERPSVYRVI